MLTDGRSVKSHGLSGFWLTANRGGCMIVTQLNSGSEIMKRRIHHKGAEVTKMMNQFKSQQAFASSLGVLRVSAGKIRAKQSQIGSSKFEVGSLKLARFTPCTLRRLSRGRHGWAQKCAEQSQFGLRRIGDKSCYSKAL